MPDGTLVTPEEVAEQESSRLRRFLTRPERICTIRTHRLGMLLGEPDQPTNLPLLHADALSASGLNDGVPIQGVKFTTEQVRPAVWSMRLNSTLWYMDHDEVETLVSLLDHTMNLDAPDATVTTETSLITRDGMMWRLREPWIQVGNKRHFFHHPDEDQMASWMVYPMADVLLSLQKSLNEGLNWLMVESAKHGPGNI